jgi:hypothetical protein
MSAESAGKKMGRDTRSSRERKPWLTTGLETSERLARGLSEAMGIIRLDSARHDLVDSFRQNASDAIGAIEDVRIAPTPHREKRTLLNRIDEIRKVQQRLIKADVSRENRDRILGFSAQLASIADEINALANEIKDKRSGGSPASRADKVRKQWCVMHACRLIHRYGRCGKPTVTEGKPLLQLSELLFEIATGKRCGSSSLKRIALELFATNDRTLQRYLWLFGRKPRVPYSFRLGCE